MGLQTALSEIFHFTYKAELEDGLIEHEVDHVFIGTTDETPHLNLDEAMGFQWKNMGEIVKEMKINPNKYTAWFRILMEEHYLTIQEAITHES